LDSEGSARPTPRRPRRRRFVPATIVALACGLLAYAAPALATADHFFSGQLGAYWEYGSTAAHTITYLEVDARSLDYICGGWESSWSGYLDDSSMAACWLWGEGSVSYTATSPSGYHAVAAYWLGYDAGGGPVEISTATHYDY
jgi:hypothetical protein